MLSFEAYVGFEPTPLHNRTMLYPVELIGLHSLGFKSIQQSHQAQSVKSLSNLNHDPLTAIK